MLSTRRNRMLACGAALIAAGAVIAVGTNNLTLSFLAAVLVLSGLALLVVGIVVNLSS